MSKQFNKNPEIPPDIENNKPCFLPNNYRIYENVTRIQESPRNKERMHFFSGNINLNLIKNFYKRVSQKFKRRHTMSWSTKKLED